MPLLSISKATTVFYSKACFLPTISVFLPAIPGGAIAPTGRQTNNEFFLSKRYHLFERLNKTAIK
jgi:hypothetical protein